MTRRLRDLCPHCGQELPTASAYLTARELDVLACWYIGRTVKKAAELAGVTQQRAKNLLSHARTRNSVHTTTQLLALHFEAVRSKSLERMQQKVSAEEAA